MELVGSFDEAQRIRKRSHEENASPREPQQEKATLIEFLEDLFEAVFLKCPWTTELQEEASLLKTSFDNGQIMSLMDTLINTARYIDLPRLAYTTWGLFSLLKGEGIAFNTEALGLPSQARNLLPDGSKMGQ